MPGLRVRAWLCAVLSLVLVFTALARADVVQRGEVRVGFDGELRPRALPGEGRAPVAVKLTGEIDAVGGGVPPRLATIRLAINRHGRLDPGAAAVCSLGQIQPATTREALATCGDAFVGEGRFSAEILLPEQPPFPSRGRVIAFNGRYRGAPAVLAHVYGTRPAPTSFTLPFRITHAKGTFATVLTAALPRVATSRAYVTGLAMTLGGKANRRERPYASAGCPAPSGFGGAVFPLARASFDFAGGPLLRTTVVRACKARN